MRTIAIVEYVLGALAGWAFVLAYQLRTHGGWRRSREGWHLMTFTTTLAVVFTLAVVVRVVEIPGIHMIAVVLYGAIVAGLIWRVALLLTATKNQRDRGRL